MLERSGNSNNYKILSGHIKFLINKAEAGFSTKRDFLLFLAFLVSTDDYQRLIGKINHEIQLFLAAPSKYWKPAKNDEANLTAQDEGKRKVIKFIIVNEVMPSALRNQISFKPELIQEFIRAYNEKLTTELAAANLDEIFSDELTFAKPAKRSPINNRTVYNAGFVMISGLLGMLSGYKIAWYLINDLSEEKDFWDLSRGERKFVMRMIAFTSLLMMALLAYGAREVFQKTTQWLDNIPIRTWTNFSLVEFLTLCQQQEDLKKFSNQKSSVIDAFWFQPSHLSVIPSKAPTLLRNYIHFELNLLEADFQAKDLCLLLSCLIFEKPVQLKDAPYSAIDALCAPEQTWTADTALAKNDCHTLIQNYFKLALIDYLTIFLEGKNDVGINKKDLLQLLSAKSAELQTQLNTLNRSKLQTKFYIPNLKFFKSILPLLIPTILLPIFLNSSLKASNKDEQSSLAMKFLWGLLAGLTTNPRLLLFGLPILYKVLKHLNVVYQNYKNTKNTCSKHTFFNNTFRKYPELERFLKRITLLRASKRVKLRVCLFNFINVFKTTINSLQSFLFSH